MSSVNLHLNTDVMNAADIFKRLKNGEVISPGDPQAYRMREASFATKELLLRMNNTADPAEIKSLLEQVIGKQIDETVTVFTPFHVNYGKHTSIGKGVFINFNCTILDLGGVVIEDEVLIAPNVSLLSEGHPVSAAERHALVPKPIHIKRNAWIGANATILQGVTIGENAIVAAGAVVNEDVPENVLVGGIPAKIIKRI